MLVPRPVFGYTTPAVYHVHASGGAPTETSCSKPVEVVGETETLIQVRYVPDPAALNIVRVQKTIKSYWDAAQIAMTQWQTQPLTVQPQVEQLLGSALGFIKDLEHGRLPAKTADPDVCTASLCLRLVQTEDGTLGGPCGDDLPPAPTTSVMLSGPKFCCTLNTDENGLACFQDLPPGVDYIITVEAPNGYKLGKTFYRDGKPVAISAQISLNEGESTSICGALSTPQGYLNIYAVFDHDRCGNTDGHALIKGALVDVYSGDKLVGCYRTPDNRSTSTATAHPVPAGVLTVVPRATIDVDGRSMRADSAAPRLLQVYPGGTADAWIRYLPGLGSISLSASLRGGGPDRPDVPLLSGVSLTLHAGDNPTGDPIRTSTTLDSGPTVFSNLPEGYYTLVASGVTTYQGNSIALINPPGGILHPTVGAGEPLVLGSCLNFGYVLGRVVVSTVDADTSAGLHDVPFTLTRVPDSSNGTYAPPRTGSTNQHGEVVLDSLQPGQWRVALAQDPVVIDGQPWTVTDEVLAVLGQPVSVANGTARIEVRMIRDIHLISGEVVTPDGEIVKHAVVEILDTSGQHVDTIYTDENGAFSYTARLPGNYLLSYLETNSGDPKRLYPVTVGKPTYAKIVTNGPVGGSAKLLSDMAPPSGDGTTLNGSANSSNGDSSNGSASTASLAESAIDLTAYPILTEEVSFPSAPRSSPPGGPSGGGSTSLAQSAEAAVRDVLNWRPKTNDPAAFTNALSQAFTLTDVEGHTQWTWTPRSYTVQTDLGAVTGAQASLYTRAKAALDQSLPLLDGLYPLNEVPQEDLDSIRSVVRDSMITLVNEFGLLGGPRVERVNELFKLLLGFPYPTDPESVKGQLRVLKQRFGLDRFRINTVDHEQNYTNLIVVIDNFISLSQTWENQHGYFDGSAKEPYMGTQLVLLSRDLEVVSELVQSLYFAMDSVFLGPAQRQTIKLNFSPDPDMFVADLLDWVDRVATQEGPRLFQNGGKDGIAAFKSIIVDLSKYVGAAMLQGNGPGQQAISATVPSAFSSPRVQRAFQALYKQLNETHADIKRIRPPVIGDREVEKLLTEDAIQHIALAVNQFNKRTTGG
jgi:hypothetical protein